MKKRLNIEGMTCNHCVMHVKNALSEVQGVKSVEVNLQGRFAVVEFEGAHDEALKAAVEDAGYDVTSITEE
jgi:copper chaperone